jgi:dimethyladenosine transferase (EC 2.1.1.-)
LLRLDDLPPLRATIKDLGILARKALGQHFLLDLNVTAKIVRLARLAPGQTVLEIGPGPGGLTRALLALHDGPIIAIERDARMLPGLQDLQAWAPDRLRIEIADALGIDEVNLFSNVSGPVAIVANLPYNIGTPLLIKWLHAGTWRGVMTLMFQKEVAERLCATPGTEAYGRLAVLTQSVCMARIEMTLPAAAFTPPPKVASAVVRLDPLPHNAMFSDLGALEIVTAAAFGQRRKMLRSSLKAAVGPHKRLDDWLAAAGIDPTARAEEISPLGFQNLARNLPRESNNSISTKT